jgi:hypothetical protein
MIDRRTSSFEASPRSNCGWTWQEAVVAVGGGDYEIRIKGRLSDALLAAFEGLTATVEPVQTVLYGPVPDQSSLHGLLGRIQSLGLELVEIRRLPASPDEPAPNPSRRYALWTAPCSSVEFHLRPSGV